MNLVLAGAWDVLRFPTTLAKGPCLQGALANSRKSALICTPSVTPSVYWECKKGSFVVDVHLIRTFWPHWGKHSGINQFVRYIDQGNYRIEEQVVSDSDDDFPIKNTSIRYFLRGLVWSWKRMDWYKLSDLWAEIKAFRRCCVRQVYVLHYLDGDHSALFLPGLLKRFGGVRPKVVASYHQPPDILASIIPRNVIEELDFIVTVSPDQVAYFETIVGPQRVRLILHGIDTGFFRPGKLPKESKKFRCITVGFWLRDFNTLREVANRLTGYRDIEFHVVSSQADGLRNLPNVKLYTGIDDSQLLKLYQQSDILFLPLLQSTANNTLLEGIACGLPVVSTWLPSVKAYLPGEEAILIHDNDPEEFVKAILHLARDRMDRENMSGAARKRAEELDWRNIALQYEAIYAELTNGASKEQCHSTHTHAATK
jgi:glycosyltransferase involved in cell wall biosynthesis